MISSGINIYLFGVLSSIIIYILIGLYAGKKVKNIEDYYVCGRNATTFFLSSTIFASMLSTNGFMGDTGYVYSGNIATIMTINAICAIGYVLGAIYFGRYIRRAKVKTMPEYFGKRFNSKRIQRFAGIVTIISLSAYFLSVIQATGILMQSLTHYDRSTCLIIALVCILCFTIYSGSHGVIITDTIMFCLFLFATLIASKFIFDEAGGLENLVQNLLKNPHIPSHTLSYHGSIDKYSIFEKMSYAVNMGLVWMITVSISPWQAGRNLMAKNEHVIFRSGAISAILTIAFLLFLYILALSVLQIDPYIQNPEIVIIKTSFEVLPKFIGMLLLTGIMAAGLSSASTFLSVISFSINKDVFNIQFKNPKNELNFTRFIVFVVGVIGLVLAYFEFSSIRIIAWFASTIIASSWGYVAWASVWSKNISEKGAFYSMVGGFFAFLIAKILKEIVGLNLNVLADPFFIALFISIVLGFYFSNNNISLQEVNFLNSLHIVPKNEIDKKEYKIDKIYGLILIAAGFYIMMILIYFWAIPYNEANYDKS